MSENPQLSLFTRLSPSNDIFIYIEFNYFLYLANMRKLIGLRSDRLNQNLIPNETEKASTDLNNNFSIFSFINCDIANLTINRFVLNRIIFKFVKVLFLSYQ